LTLVAFKQSLVICCGDFSLTRETGTLNQETLTAFQTTVPWRYFFTTIFFLFLLAVFSCSAGVGRTGAFVVIDAMLESIRNKKIVDVFNYVQLLRNNRISMVQTEVRGTL